MPARRLTAIWPLLAAVGIIAASFIWSVAAFPLAG
jgi:hypothetical protein